MGLSSSISLKTNPHTAPKVPNLPHSILEGVKRLLLLGCSCHVVGSAKKHPFPSVKMEMEEDVEAAVQGYGGVGSTPVQPLWQKRVLMGERCEMPRFSGLILYDERGFPLPATSNPRAAPANRVCDC